MDQDIVAAGRVALLGAIASGLARSPDLETSVRSIVDAVGPVLGTQVVAVFSQDPERDELQFVAATGIEGASLDGFVGAVTGGLHPIAEVARSRQPVWGREAAPDSAAVVGADIPLTVVRGGTDVPLGVASFGWGGGHEITPDERMLVGAVADLLAVAIDRHRLESLAAEHGDWLERMAQSDPLTGLANARTFGRVLELEVARASRQGSELSLAIFDVDSFESVNAEAGRAAGDDVLRAVAAILAESVRLVDTVARYGGDEFVLVAPGSAGTTVARRVLEAVSALPAVDGHRISVSAGVARFPTDGATADELIAAADAALRQAKTAGAGGMETADARP